DPNGNLFVSEYGASVIREVGRPNTALTGATWTTTNPYTAEAAQYTWTGTTSSVANLTSVTFTVPSGTLASAPTVANVTGLPAGGSISLSGTTLTYSFPSTAVLTGTAFTLAVDGFTNTPVRWNY